ncbi:Thiolase, N-terminal domain-containing protein [Suillus bovinus]|uniref:Thiolase, N-terminal domain-containing protein n=1 Tax=Suillus bovinus TaxID=48563 RepID=UPI001B862626|nr:Thiolase, N-terminal domain-containing protein [Suillus bovinus]KAG2136077.1 Thiolase, N-terminal domain-containing protein [Suillus bovinus]
MVSSSARARLLAKNDNDIVIVAAVRSALAKARKGGFKDTRPEEMLSGVLRAAYTRAMVDPALIGDIAVGNVLPPGGGANVARMAALHAGIPNTTPINTVNRQCSSGLTAVDQIANEIISGQIDIGIGSGVESMTFAYGGGWLADGWSAEVLTNPEAEECLLPMGMTAENLASEFNISREVQDKYAAISYQKAAAAHKAGKFKDEIVPLKVKITDPKTEKVSEIIVDVDEGIRDGVTAETLSKLQPIFVENGATHAGNASQVCDGAAAVVLARRSVAKRLGLPIVGKYVTSAVVGVPPRVMGVGPAYAIPKLLERTGLSKDDVDFYEINEAFASQAVYNIQKLGLSLDKVNVNGGAIGIGHPLGCTGARQIATGLNIAKQRNERVFVTSMCSGSGIGMAGVLVSEH